MEKEKVYALPLRKVSPAILTKALKKGRTEEEFLRVVGWLTGYSSETIEQQLERDIDYKTFFDEAPAWNPDSRLVTGTVCGDGRMHGLPHRDMVETVRRCSGQRGYITKKKSAGTKNALRMTDCPMRQSKSV